MPAGRAPVGLVDPPTDALPPDLRDVKQATFGWLTEEGRAAGSSMSARTLPWLLTGQKLDLVP